MSAERDMYFDLVEGGTGLAEEASTDTVDNEAEDDSVVTSIYAGRGKAKKASSLGISEGQTAYRQLDATQMYLNEIGFSPLLSPDEEVYFARLAQKGDEAGRKRMIESNLRSG